MSAVCETMKCELCLAKSEIYRVVYENEMVLVMFCIEPMNDGHVMILPSRHVENLADLEPIEAHAFLQAIDMCMEALSRFSADPPMCLLNGWKHRSQSHLHMHILPSKLGMRELFAASLGIPERIRADQSALKEKTDVLKKFFVK